ncbi:PRC-barrel domain-containing protein [Ensifer soli]|uniref:PRC-barrel domain-containing protein n=1 Tax=Ciceribacter sp. sgz301302 TaxID=3342379 RepID=UPI0035BA9BB5
MTQKTVASIAAGALLAGVAAFAPLSFAQDATQPQTTQPQTMETAPATGMETAPATGMDSAADGTVVAPNAETTAQATQPAEGTGFLTEQSAEQVVASNYIGQSVYNAADESIGQINDLVLAKDGQIAAAIVGVGGFLGIGEKNVAVPFDSITVSENPDNGSLKLTSAETAEGLKAAPTFMTRAQVLAQQDATSVDTAPTASTTAPAEQPATGMGAQPAPAE